jgi:hypothetical protein
MTPANDDAELPQHDREALARLADGDVAPQGLEGQVVDHLRARGLLRGSARRRRLTWMAAMLIASAATFGLGRHLGARQAAAIGGPKSGPEFLVLLYEDQGFDRGAPGEERARVVEYGAWARRLADRSQLVSAGRLGGAADAVQLPQTDAPPRSSSTEPTGYFVIVAADRQEAVRVASTCPHLRYGGRVVVRPIG